MPIIQAGKQFTAASLKETAGNLASMMADTIQSGTDFASQIASWTDEDLVALGMTAEEAAAVRGFYVSELPAVKTALESSFFLRSLIGLGV
jgi:hypothetical protein